MELPYSDLQIFYKGVPQFDNGLLRTPALSRGPFVYHLSIQVSPPSLPKSNLQYLKKLQQQGTKAELKGKKKYSPLMGTPKEEIEYFLLLVFIF